MLSPELQSTLLWVVVITGILIISSVFTGAILLVIPVFFGGVFSVLGAVVGDLFGGSIAGAIVGGVIGVIGTIVIWIHYEEKRDREQEARRKRSGGYY